MRLVGDSQARLALHGEYKLLGRKVKKSDAEPLRFPIKIKLCLPVTGRERCSKEVRGFDGELFEHQGASESDLIRRAPLDMHTWRKNTADGLHRPFYAEILSQAFGRQVVE